MYSASSGLDFSLPAYGGLFFQGLYMVTIDQLIELSHEVNEDNEVLVLVAVTQAIHESKKGTGWSDLATKYNNWFGIKGPGSVGQIDLKTKEVVKGTEHVEKQGFSVNASIEDSFKQHRRLMNKSRYDKVRSARTPEVAFKELYKAGYATDPKYPERLLAIFNQYVII